MQATDGKPNAMPRQVESTGTKAAWHLGINIRCEPDFRTNGPQYSCATLVKMWNVIFENQWCHWYTYPFVYGLSACLFLFLSVRRSLALSSNPRQQADSCFHQLRVLDSSFGLLIVLLVTSSAGGVVYSELLASPSVTGGTQIVVLTSDAGFFSVGLLAFLAGKRIKGLSLLLRIWSGPLLLAGSVGAVGCFSFGCCFGRPVSTPWWPVVSYPTRFDANQRITGAPAVKEQIMLGVLDGGASNSLPVVPVQLYCSVLLLLGGAIISLLSKMYDWNGWFLLAMAYYMLVRVILDPFRGDYFHGLTGNRVEPAARLWMLVALVVLLLLHASPRGPWQINRFRRRLNGRSRRLE